MYDDLLNIDLATQRLGLTGHSPATLITLADDMAVIATGRSMDILEERGAGKGSHVDEGILFETSDC